jgi:hypothetical protein
MYVLSSLVSIIQNTFSPEFESRRVFQACDFCTSYVLAERNNFGVGAVFLSRLVSNLQKQTSPGLEPRTLQKIFSPGLEPRTLQKISSPGLEPGTFFRKFALSEILFLVSRQSIQLCGKLIDLSSCLSEHTCIYPRIKNFNFI